MPDHDRDRRRFAALGIATVDRAAVVRAEEPHPQVAIVVDVVPVDAGVDPAAVRIPHHRHGGGQKRPTVQLVMYRNRQATQVYLIATPDDLLDRSLRRRHLDRVVRLAAIQRAGVAGQLVDGAIQCQCHPVVGGQQVRDAGDVAVDDVGEQECRELMLLVGPGTVGSEAESPVHLSINPLDGARLTFCEVSEKGAQILRHLPTFQMCSVRP